MENEKEVKIFDPTADLSLAGRQNRLKRGLGSQQLLKDEIVQAQLKARSAFEAARILGVCYNTYKKYAKLYDVFKDLKNPEGNGISKGFNKKRGLYAIDDLIAGKYPDYPVWKLKHRLILHGYMLEKCDNCGFEEKRLIDNRVPLTLQFHDDDRTNHRYENLYLLCLNCTYLTIGNLSGTQKMWN